MSRETNRLTAELEEILRSGRTGDRVFAEPTILSIRDRVIPVTGVTEQQLTISDDPGVSIRRRPEAIMDAMSESFTHEDYTVGWICALPLDMGAAKGMLDRQHRDLPRKRVNDKNNYIYGQIGPFNVVIACLPSGELGTVSAAVVAEQMLSSFTKIRFGLMVGIGGGIPRDHVPIHLGDIVVSKAEGEHGGVIQYNFGRTVEGGKFVHTGTLTKPPKVLSTAVSRLEADYLTDGSKIPAILTELRKSRPLMAENYHYPGEDKDVLFEASYDHSKQSFTECDACDTTKSLRRSARPDKNPKIWYGLIGSDNNLLRDGIFREELQRELNILCVEMEAAGLMDNFPCLVIRGICDYADTHKNKLWQAYAAANAAAYAKELLSVIPLDAVDKTETASEIVQNAPSLELNANSDINFRDTNQRSPLHLASYANDETLVQVFVEKMTPEQIGRADVGNFTALHLCRGNLRIIKTILAKMLPEHLATVNCYLYNVLDEAVMTWSVDAIKMILEKMEPDDINRRTASGWTTLYRAASAGCDDAIPPLLVRMREKDIWHLTREPHQETALHASCRKNVLVAVEALVEIGNVRQLKIRDGTGQTALHHAAAEGHNEVVECLLRKMDQDGITEPDHLGETALHKACERRNRTVVSMLLEKIEDPEDIKALNKTGSTASDLALASNDRTVANMIRARLDAMQ